MAFEIIMDWNLMKVIMKSTLTILNIGVALIGVFIYCVYTDKIIKFMGALLTIASVVMLLFLLEIVKFTFIG